MQYLGEGGGKRKGREMPILSSFLIPSPSDPSLPQFHYSSIYPKTIGMVKEEKKRGKKEGERGDFLLIYF